MREKGVLPRSKIFFHTSSRFAKKALFCLSNAGTYFCSNLYETKRKRYDEYLFMYIKRGKIEVQYENQTFIAPENTFIFLDCHKPHVYRALEYSSFEWVHFSGNASKSYFELLFRKSGCVYSLHANWEIPDSMSRILTMMEHNDVDEHAASIIIHNILYELKKISTRADYSLEEAIVKSAVSYIKSHYREKINLRDIAGCVKLSPYYFSRVFKKNINCSPYQYLIMYRINNAKKLLYNTNLSIKEIAFSCGFNSVSHFVTTFKKHSNLTPNKFREIKL